MNKREKIIKDLEAGKDYIISDGRVYFLSINKYPVSHEESYYFKRRGELSKYFEGREESEKKRLILENLSLLAVPLEKEYSKPKVEIFRYNLGGFTFKISNYDENDPIWGDNTDIVLRRSLTDIRTGEEIEESPWRTERNDWIFEYAKKIRNKLREGLNI